MLRCSEQFFEMINVRDSPCYRCLIPSTSRLPTNSNSSMHEPATWYISVQCFKKRQHVPVFTFSPLDHWRWRRSVVGELFHFCSAKTGNLSVSRPEVILKVF